MQYPLQHIRERINITHVILIWFLINIISAFFTQLYSDEAYYALFAKYPDFGYFDHPPMIAFMIRVGSFIFKNEFGVRILSVIAVAIALFFTYKLAEVDKPFLFLISILSIFGLNVIGFLALPDSPLLLFTVLFFVVYKKFLLKESLVTSFFLGLTIAAMLYSKYHGVLIILFTVISNPRIIKSFKFRIALAVAFIIFIPHIIWQLNNNFVSISYHLFERSSPVYKSSYTFEYILGQLLYYGPLSVIFMLITAFTFKQSDLFEKALKWNLLGFLCFFLLCTLKGRVEVNWTLPIIIPLLIFFLKSNDARPVIEKWFYRLALPVILIIIFLRLAAICPCINLGINRIDDFKGHKEFVKDVVDKSQGLPLITNTYQRAGIISFYSNSFVPSININSRRNQFNLWHSDNRLRFKKVAYVNNYLDEGIEIHNPEYKDYKVTIIDSLPVMNDILISTGLRKIVAQSNDTVNIKVLLSAGNKSDCYRDAGKYFTRLHAGLYRDQDLMYEKVCTLPVDLILKDNEGEYNFQFNAPEQSGRYKILISLSTTELGSWSNKKTIYLIVR